MAHNRAKHSLEVKGGAHRLTDLPQGSQLADRLSQLARPRLKFFEQTNVLNCDHGLVSKSLEQRDLLVCERTDLLGRPSRSNGMARIVRVPVSCWKAGDSGN